MTTQDDYLQPTPTPTPPRRAGSVRRTTTHDCTWRDGLTGPVTIAASGRDLLTSRGGSEPTAAAWFECDAELGGTIRNIVGSAGGLDALIGGSAHRGFRRSLRDIAEDAAGVLVQLLDDLPVALMLSGRVPRAAGIALGEPGRQLPIDVCAGWTDGGTLVRGLTAQGPPLVIGPPAGPVAPIGDPEAWHPCAGPTPRSTRRHRRIDAWVEHDRLQLDSWFRDSHVGDDGVERVVHEYGVRAAADLPSFALVACDAVAGHLPYPECPNAATSSGRLVGSPLDALRKTVPSALTGSSTCTHLNDALRALSGVRALVAPLPGIAWR